MSYTEEEKLWDMSDEELMTAVKEAKSDEVDVPEEQEESNKVVDDSVESEVNDNEEEYEDGPEQPEEDSDHDASDEEEEEEVGSEEDSSEDAEDTPDEETEATDGEAAEEATETKPESQQAQSLKFKADGKEYEFTDKEIVEQFPRVFGQAMNYTRKMQAIKPWRKTIDAIEQAKLSHDDVNLMIDALSGNKDAVAQVLKRTGVDALDLDLENSDYVAKDYGRDEKTLAIEEVVETISQDPEFAVTENVLTKQWDESSLDTLTQDPELIRLLHEDVKSGMYDTISPIMNKLKVYDGAKKTDLDYYKLAARQYFSELDKKQQEEYLLNQKQQQEQEAQAKQQRIEKAKANEVKRQQAKRVSAKRKAAAPTKARATNSVVDYLDDSDEAFEEWYKKVMDQ